MAIRLAICTGIFTDERRDTTHLIKGDEYESQPDFICRVAREYSDWLHSGASDMRLVNLQIVLED